MEFEHMTIEELGNWVSDFYKDLNGFRPRHLDFSNREQLVAAAIRLDDEFESLKSTIDGRQYLREMGFCLPSEDKTPAGGRRRRITTKNPEEIPRIHLRPADRIFCEERGC